MAAPLTPHQPQEEQQQLLPCRFHLGKLPSLKRGGAGAALQPNSTARSVTVCEWLQGPKE